MPSMFKRLSSTTALCNAFFVVCQREAAVPRASRLLFAQRNEVNSSDHAAYSNTHACTNRNTHNYKITTAQRSTTRPCMESQPSPVFVSVCVWWSHLGPCRALGVLIR